MKNRLALTPLILLAWLGGSSHRLVVEPIVAHPIRIIAARIEHPVITLTPALRYIGGWTLTSDDKDFGGLSSLAIDRGGFVAISDIGAIVRFSITPRGTFDKASIGPLPKGCARNRDKTDRDSESITRDPATGQSWIGFEWRNAICRTGGAMKVAERLAQPAAMRHWPKTGGPETIVRLADGRILVFAETAQDEFALPPLLIFDSDPTLPDAPVRAMRYQPPEHHFSPTDAAELPDGRLLVINRRFEPPISFSAILSLVDPITAATPGPVLGKTMARLSRPGVTSNFEGVAVSREGARNFVWIISDDNYLWITGTYLLKFELLPEPAANPAN